MRYTDKYLDLANAIVKQAVDDYRNSDNPREVYEIVKFIKSDWFKVLTKVNPDYLLSKLRLERYGR